MTSQTATETTSAETTSTETGALSHPMIFVNLPVADIDASRKFFTAIGYGFDEQMCNGEALALELGPNLYAMLLRRDFFAGFHTAATADPGHHEVLTCLAAGSVEEVDRIVDAAVAAGGKDLRTEREGEWMYGRSYTDLDGHIWEIMWMDVEAAAAAGAFG